LRDELWRCPRYGIPGNTPSRPKPKRPGGQLLRLTLASFAGRRPAAGLALIGGDDVLGLPDLLLKRVFCVLPLWSIAGSPP
jgi:hypothetical protein